VRGFPGTFSTRHFPENLRREQNTSRKYWRDLRKAIGLAARVILAGEAVVPQNRARWARYWQLPATRNSITRPTRFPAKGHETPNRYPIFHCGEGRSLARTSYSLQAFVVVIHSQNANALRALATVPSASDSAKISLTKLDRQPHPKTKAAPRTCHTLLATFPLAASWVLTGITAINHRRGAISGRIVRWGSPNGAV
jgi:hypothetical protein